jgi:hypothetical protein
MREPAVESPGDQLIPHHVAQTLHPSFAHTQLTLKMTSHCAHVAAMREPAVERAGNQLIVLHKPCNQAFLAISSP